MERLFKIGDFCFRIRYGKEIVPPEHFMRFAVEEGKVMYTYTLKVCEAFPEPDGELIVNQQDIAVFRKGELEMRYIGVKGGRSYYACYQEVSTCAANVYVIADKVQDLQVDPVFVSLLSLERQLTGLILHCAYIEHQGRAILFSAPSGTGKSTQAGLWEKYRGSRTVNGDRSLLQNLDGTWVAEGWPVCGSSEICHNERHPIQAIVLLSQGLEDKIERVAMFRAFSLLYSQVTINFWNREAQQKAMDLIERLAAEVPVYHLSCTISEEAVRCLETIL